MLAGISAEYYLRLEVGRDKHPSAQVVEALARALRLDTKATQHLHSLANPTGSDDPDLEGARAYALTELIDQFLTPAVVANRYLDVLTSNAIARALSPEFTPGQNILRWRFLDPTAHEIYPDWGEATESLVCGLRELTGPCTAKDHRMRALIDELCSVSAHFRELWIEGTAVGYHAGIRHIRHPLVGDLYLYTHRLNTSYAGGDHVVVYRAESGSDSARALEKLRSMSAAPPVQSALPLESG